MTPDRIWARPYVGVRDAGDWNGAEGVIDGSEFMPATPQHAAQLLLSHIENNNDIRQSIDPSGHCVKLIHGLRAIAEEQA